jgi:hypothetical protein
MDEGTIGKKEHACGEMLPADDASFTEPMDSNEETDRGFGRQAMQPRNHGASTVKNPPDFSAQLVHQERFLEKSDPAVRDPVLHDSFVCIP